LFHYFFNFYDCPSIALTQKQKIFPAKLADLRRNLAKKISVYQRNQREYFLFIRTTESD